MSIKQTICLLFDVEVFQTEEFQQVKVKAETSKGEIYSWKTSENSNWLEKGFSNVDVLGLIVLPQDLPVQIEMPDDINED